MLRFFSRIGAQQRRLAAPLVAPRALRRYFTTEQKEEAKKESPKESPVNWTTVGVLLTLGGSSLFYYQYQIEKKKAQRETSKQLPSLGRPLVGGPFRLLDHNGQEVTDQTFRGKYMLLYFGFTHCPDICPTEMKKMGQVIDMMDNMFGPIVQPIFVTVDPKRDKPSIVANYVKQWHPRMVGLTGSVESVTAAAKAFRVYISSVPQDTTDDYLVDHSICFYLMDTNGQIMDYFGQHYTTEECVTKMTELLRQDQEALKTGQKKQL